MTMLSTSDATENTLYADSQFLHRVLDIGLAFKHQRQIFRKRAPARCIRDLLVDDIPHYGSTPDAVLQSFVDVVLPLCKNEASPQFLGFGDTGDDAAALAGGILAMFTQQNLINQSFDSPSATFVEIAVLRWLRNLLGFTNSAVPEIATVWDVGGVITHGGTTSNTAAMMLAREHMAPGTMSAGVVDPERFGVVVPRGIGHYSVNICSPSTTWYALPIQGFGCMLTPVGVWCARSATSFVLGSTGSSCSTASPWTRTR